MSIRNLPIRHLLFFCIAFCSASISLSFLNKKECTFHLDWWWSELNLKSFDPSRSLLAVWPVCFWAWPLSLISPSAFPQSAISFSIIILHIRFLSRFASCFRFPYSFPTMSFLNIWLHTFLLQNGQKHSNRVTTNICPKLFVCIVYNICDMFPPLLAGVLQNGKILVHNLLKLLHCPI